VPLLSCRLRNRASVALALRWVNLRRGHRAASTFACLLLAVIGVCWAEEPEMETTSPIPTTQAIYAGFTVNLPRFISWPDNSLGAADAPFVIGTFVRDPINDELDAAVRGESIAGHPIRTRRLHSLNDIRKCHVVFFSRGIADPAAIIAHTEHRPILTISDVDGFLTVGGHVRFAPHPSRIGLQIWALNLKASGLEARAQLLRLASEP
jgi:hypothetical protein